MVFNLCRVEGAGRCFHFSESTMLFLAASSARRHARDKLSYPLVEGWITDLGRTIFLTKYADDCIHLFFGPGPSPESTAFSTFYRKIGSGHFDIQTALAAAFCILHAPKEIGNDKTWNPHSFLKYR